MVGSDVVVDDGADTFDMNASRSNVSRDQRLHLAGGELGQRSRALGLAAPAVKRCRSDAPALQLLGHAVAAVPGPAEHDRRTCGIDRLGADFGSISFGHAPEHVVGSPDIGSLVADLVAHGIALIIARQRCHVSVERGGEQHGLAPCGGLVEQAPDSRDESHVGHAVGFVDHDLVDSGQVGLTLGDQIL